MLLSLRRKGESAVLHLSRQQVVYICTVVVFTATLLSQFVAGTAPGVGWHGHGAALAAPGTMPEPIGTIPPYQMALPYVVGGGGGTIPPADYRMFLPIIRQDAAAAE